MFTGSRTTLLMIPLIPLCVNVFSHQIMALMLHWSVTHHEMLLVWDIVNEKPFHVSSIRTKPDAIDLHWQGVVLLSTYDTFQLVSWLPMPFCTSFYSCFNTSLPLSLDFITQILTYLFSSYAWITWAITNILCKFCFNSTIRNIFTEKNSDV